MAELLYDEMTREPLFNQGYMDEGTIAAALSARQKI